MWCKAESLSARRIYNRYNAIQLEKAYTGWYCSECVLNNNELIRVCACLVSVFELYYFVL